MLSSVKGQREKEMKKLSNVLMASVLVFSAACSKPASNTPAESTTPEATAEATAEASTAPETPEVKVMSYAEYDAAAIDDEVVIEAYVQGKQSWWDNKATVYLQDEDGAYFLYELACTEEDYAKLTEGQKIRVHGFKSEWDGEVEIVDGTFEIVDGNWVAEPVDATELWGTVDMISRMNQKVVFKGVTVEEYVTKDGEHTGAAFAYKNAEEKTDDLYYQVTLGDTTYDFCVEYYLCNQDTDVYKAVEALQPGDVVDVEGFLYWYQGPNLHTTKVTPAK